MTVDNYFYKLVIHRYTIFTQCLFTKTLFSTMSIDRYTFLLIFQKREGGGVYIWSMEIEHKYFLITS